MELNLELGETKCHTVNPKHFEDCDVREDMDKVGITLTLGFRR